MPADAHRPRGRPPLPPPTPPAGSRLAVAGPDPDRPGHWLCRCRCGKTGLSVRRDAVRSGRTKSCGCHRSDRAGARLAAPHP